jgi:hypothetical protein
MIRIATLEDIEAVLELGKQSLIDGPYAGKIQFNVDRARGFVTNVINVLGKIVLWEEGGQAVGLLAFIFFPHYFSGEPTAQELMYYVRPEFRAVKSFGDSPSLRLLQAAEQIAINLGAKKFQLTAPAKTGLGLLYDRVGYRLVEEGYQKCL